MSGSFHILLNGIVSCLTKRYSIFGEEYINLLEVRGSYTGYKNGSADVWRMMDEIVKTDPLLTILLSGIRYSISTHLCLFYRDFFGMHVSNPSLFLKRFDDSHRIKFYPVYILVRRCVGYMTLDSVLGVNGELLKMIEYINKKDHFATIEYPLVDMDRSI